ncbi:hypothetical protein AUC61_17185 [Pseudomonas sp. S25]|uniref:Uncharacterized protein n=1 Tax=Pseudomonas maioricensis TaxID=1766623 RepID=A0ABS9ZL07_9PSED|nr:hypothetical protein [Pseudomonas sp. S25]
MKMCGKCGSLVGAELARDKAGHYSLQIAFSLIASKLCSHRELHFRSRLGLALMKVSAPLKTCG